MNLANVTNLARNIWKDLVERRLWPVALVLVIALVAIPVVLAKPAPPVPVAPTAVASELRSGAARRQRGFDPLQHGWRAGRRQVQGPVPPTSCRQPGGDFRGRGGEGPRDQRRLVFGGRRLRGLVRFGRRLGGGGSGGGSGGGPSAEDTGTRLKIEFGLAGGKRTVREISPGTPLPASSNPLIVFLGFGKDGTRPVFLVSSDVVKTEGEGTCKPSKSVCSELTLAVGDAQFFDAQNGDQYQLDVLGVVKG